MTRYAIVLWIAWLGFSPLVVNADSPTQTTRTLTILHTNDTHAHTLPNKDGIGGYATIAGYIRRVKSQRDDVLVLDAGDRITGTPISAIFKGQPVFKIMNTIPYDVTVLGNHDFDFGWQAIDGFAKIADPPLPASQNRIRVASGR